MLLYLSGSEIIGYSKSYLEEDAQVQIQNGSAVLYDGEFSFCMGENRDGFRKEFYYDTDTNKIRVEYEPIQPKEPTMSETVLEILDSVKRSHAEMQAQEQSRKETENAIIEMAVNMEYMVTLTELKEQTAATKGQEETA